MSRTSLWKIVTAASVLAVAVVAGSIGSMSAAVPRANTAPVESLVDGEWVGRSTSFAPDADCGQDVNEMRLMLHQSGSDVSGLFYTKVAESFRPPDVGLERTRVLTTGSVSGNTFSFTYGPPGLQRSGIATITATAITGTIVESASCPNTAFTLVRR